MTQNPFIVGVDIDSVFLSPPQPSDSKDRDSDNSLNHCHATLKGPTSTSSSGSTTTTTTLDRHLLARRPLQKQNSLPSSAAHLSFWPEFRPFKEEEEQENTRREQFLHARRNSSSSNRPASRDEVDHLRAEQEAYDAEIPSPSSGKERDYPLFPEYDEYEYEYEELSDTDLLGATEPARGARPSPSPEEILSSARTPFAPAAPDMSNDISNLAAPPSSALAAAPPTTATATASKSESAAATSGLPSLPSSGSTNPTSTSTAEAKDSTTAAQGVNLTPSTQLDCGDTQLLDTNGGNACSYDLKNHQEPATVKTEYPNYDGGSNAKEGESTTTDT